MLRTTTYQSTYPTVEMSQVNKMMQKIMYALDGTRINLKIVHRCAKYALHIVAAQGRTW